MGAGRFEARRFMRGKLVCAFLVFVWAAVSLVVLPSSAQASENSVSSIAAGGGFNLVMSM